MCCATCDFMLSRLVMLCRFTQGTHQHHHAPPSHTTLGLLRVSWPNCAHASLLSTCRTDVLCCITQSQLQHTPLAHNVLSTELLAQTVCTAHVLQYITQAQLQHPCAPPCHPSPSSAPTSHASWYLESATFQNSSARTSTAAVRTRPVSTAMGHTSPCTT